MKRAALGALLISLVAASAAMAGSPPTTHYREHGNRHEQRHHDRNDRHDRRDWNDRRHDRRDDHRYDHRRNDRHDHRRWDHHRGNHHFHGRPAYRFENGRYHWGVYHRPHGYVHRHWHRGARLPRAYYGPTYVINNYGDCGLRRPPRGHHWVRVDHDAVLAVIATGVVLDVALNHFW